MSSELIPELTNGEFESYISDGIVLIDFWAEWCMPCLMMAPVLEELAEKMKDKIKIGKVDVEDNQILAQKFQVNSIPNFVLFKEGEIVARFVGAMDVEELENKIKDFL